MSMVTIRSVVDSDTPALLAIQLTPSQVQFAASPQAFLNNRDSDGVDRYVIESDGQLVGFFKVEPDFFQQYDFCSHGAIGLRSFAIDNRFQGQGLGTASVKRMVSQLGDDYPDAKEIYLTVNCRNPAARMCYLNAGFIDTEQLYLGGPAGPQHIMSADLKSVL
ncbi:GNAT family N-acetyltransferase [Vibrio hippocampi]|uniref:N-acetyltransferase domain-containing protein n=1 Tax=Vibrio hippocampi TaxID=654686 RepID=A0ABM8ZL03_9VIBR|nr:GNAT family N-acetyltransferase [Vibrio hippocampi]CAH0528921.1 hypothetical protein VHP8226_02951 [Vibrio hippocampi]